MQFSETPNMSEPNPEFQQQAQGANKQVMSFTQIYLAIMAWELVLCFTQVVFSFFQRFQT